MGRTENITDPSDAKTILVQFYHYFAYPDFPYHCIHCCLLCCLNHLTSTFFVNIGHISSLLRVQKPKFR